MAQVKIFNKNNTIHVAGKSYPAGTLVASNSGDLITMRRTDNNRDIVRDVKYTRLLNKDGNVWAASATATVTALNDYIGVDNPDGIIKDTDKITALRGLSTLDFTSGKARQFVYATGLDDGISTTDKVRLTSTGEIIVADNLTVTGNIAVTGTVDNVDVNALSSTVSSINSYPAADASKLAGIADGAEVNVNADWNATTGDALILNKPTIPTATSQLTNDSGFVTSAGITDVVQDTTPQLGGNLDLNGNDVTGTGDINITGGVTTSGDVFAFGAISVGGNLTAFANASFNGTLGVTGTTNLGTVNVGTKLTTPAIDFSGLGGTSTVGISSVGGGSPSDLELQSNGNVTIVLDDDNNETDQYFRIQSGDGTIIWQVNEGGVTSGLLTTVTPTFSGTQSSYQQGSSASITISNHVSGRSHQGAIYNSSGVEQTANPVTIDSSGNVSFTAPATIATGYELRVFSADAGKLRSVEATVTFEVTASRNFSYWRLQVVNSSGAQIEDKVYLLEIDFYTGANATGTVYPTAAVASSGSGGGATITSGYFHSATYADWKAFDNSTGSGWWTLGLNNLAGSNQHLNWIQMELTGGSQTIQSVRIRSNPTYTDADYIQILGSNTGDFTGEEILCGTLSGIANSSDVTQNI